jgi:hypothetical protein
MKQLDGQRLFLLFTLFRDVSYNFTRLKELSDVIYERSNKENIDRINELFKTTDHDKNWVSWKVRR